MLDITCLGPMAVCANGSARPLPASRKTRALLAYLALEQRRHRREQLCELLWDIPDDPRAALRWSLTKLRPLLDTPDRLIGSRDDVELASHDLHIDVLAVRAALAGGLDQLPDERLQRLFDTASETFLAGGEVPAQPLFDAWIGAVRHEMTVAARRLGEALLARPLGSAAHLAIIARMIAADPHDADLHGRRIALLTAGGDRAEAAQASSAATRLVGEVEGNAAQLVAAATARAAAATPGTAPASAGHEAAPVRREATGVLARVLVQPFSAIGSAAIAAPLAQLLANSIADNLARYSTLSVLNSGGSAASDSYVVSGSVVQTGDQLRVRCRLTEPDGAILWSDELCREGEDLIALEADVTIAIVSVLEARIRFTEAARAQAGPKTGADGHFLQALGHMAGDGDFEAVVRLLEQALAIDPDHGLSGAYLPWAAMQTGRIDSPEAAARFAAIARHAVHSAPDDVMVQAVGGLMNFLFGRDFDGALVVIDRARRLQPMSMFPWMARGWMRIYGGDSAGAIADFNRAEALSLADPTDNNVNAGRALACFQAGDLEAARQWAQRGAARARMSLEALRMGVAVAVEQGRLDDARQTATTLLTRNPLERAGRTLLMPYKLTETPRRLYNAYLAAGIPH